MGFEDVLFEDGFVGEAFRACRGVRAWVGLEVLVDEADVGGEVAFLWADPVSVISLVQSSNYQPMPSCNIERGGRDRSFPPLSHYIPV